MAADEIACLVCYLSEPLLTVALKKTTATGVCVGRDLHDAGGEVNSDVHLAVYRILQEHMTNVLKHAKASSVQVSLSIDKEKLRLSVTDNGVGFNLQQKHTGIGIANMITRAETVKGLLSLNSAPGCGCELTVSIPL